MVALGRLVIVGIGKPIKQRANVCGGAIRIGNDAFYVEQRAGWTHGLRLSIESGVRSPRTSEREYGFLVSQGAIAHIARVS